MEGMVCIMCRRPKNGWKTRYRSHLVNEALQEVKPLMAAYLEHHAEVQIDSETNFICCHKCWQQADVAIRRALNKPRAHRPQIKDDMPQLKDGVPQINDDMPQIKDDMPQINDDMPQIKDDMPQINDDMPQIPSDGISETSDDSSQMDHGMVILTEYSRAPNTASSCVFKTCVNHSRKRIPASIRVYMLCTHKVYIPESTRACEKHLASNYWDTLPDMCNLMHDFSAAQVSSIFKLLTEAVIKQQNMQGWGET